MEWRDSVGIHTTFGGRMRIGSLVKWVRSDESYGDLGVVFSVDQYDGTCEVHWTDGQFVTYGRDEQDNFLKVVKI